MAYNVGILGATGAVGQELIRLMHERAFPMAELRLLASARSAGKTQTYEDKTWTIQEATPEAFEGLDVCIFSAGGSQSKLFADEAVKRGCIVIDNSSCVSGWMKTCRSWCRRSTQRRLLSTRGSSRIRTVRRSSGSGAGGIIELENQVKALVEGKEVVKDVYPHQIAFNVLPHVDRFFDDGYTKEEMKMLNEGRKIMSLPELKVTCTCVRVPVYRAHSISVSAAFEKPVSVEAAREAVAAFDGWSSSTILPR